MYYREKTRAVDKSGHHRNISRFSYYDNGVCTGIIWGFNVTVNVPVGTSIANAKKMLVSKADYNRVHI